MRERYVIRTDRSDGTTERVKWSEAIDKLCAFYSNSSAEDLERMLETGAALRTTVFTYECESDPIAEKMRRPERAD